MLPTCVNPLTSNQPSTGVVNPQPQAILKATEDLVQDLITAQTQNRESVESLLRSNAYSIDVCKQAMLAALELSDKSGNNVAIELAKVIDKYFGSGTLWDTEKLVSKKSNLALNKSLSVQLEKIRNLLQNAINKAQWNEKSNAESIDWWVNEPAIQKAAIDTEMEALRAVVGSKNAFNLSFAGPKNGCSDSLYNELSKTKEVCLLNEDQITKGSVDVYLAPHTLYHEMETLFHSSEQLLNKDNPLPVEKHPLFKYFDALKEDGAFIATLFSGPNVCNFTDLLLGKHGLKTDNGNQAPVNIKIFNNIETFFRCLDIFKTSYEKKTGKTIDIELSYSMAHLPLETFCDSYLKQFPELAKVNLETREKIAHLLAALSEGNDLTDLNITLKMTVQEKKEKRSFKPVFQEHAQIQKGSNEITSENDRQLQNLNGSELSMPHIKDADGTAQLKAFESILDQKHLNIVDLGGGRGETNAIFQAILESGVDVNLLNIEPHKLFADDYEKAHRAVGINDVKVIPLSAQNMSSQDVINHFKGEKASGILASHSFYFILNDLLKASLDSSLPLNQHPLWKLIEAMQKNAVLVASMQTGAGGRLIRNALLGNHGLNSSPNSDAPPTLLNSFGNIATFLKYFEGFAKRYEEETGKKIECKMHSAVANVPLGDFKVQQDPETGGYVLINPKGDNKTTIGLAPIMLDFYGNWFELEFLATLTQEKGQEVIAQFHEFEKKKELHSTPEFKELEKKYNILKTQDLFTISTEKMKEKQTFALEKREEIFKQEQTIQDFNGPLFELEFLASLTQEKGQGVITQFHKFEKMKEMHTTQEYKESAKKYHILKAQGLLTIFADKIGEKRASAKKMQETYLHILPAFAPAAKNMQHPNITLEIKVL